MGVLQLLPNTHFMMQTLSIVIRAFQSSIKIKLHYLDQLLLCSWVGGGVSQNFNGDLKGIRIEIKEWICECNLPSCHQRPLRGSTCPAKHQNILHEQLDMGLP